MARSELKRPSPEHGARADAEQMWDARDDLGGGLVPLREEGCRITELE